MQRRAEFRPFSWLFDLWKRDQLDLSPPYQRRSVWPDRFRSEFVETVLLNYPCPAVFLFEEIRPDGTFFYKVVDGKQRLTTMFDFVTDQIIISDSYPNMSLRGLPFSRLDDATKLGVWRYAFSVEFIEQENDALINDIFNRINKNVAKLTQQELRHALFSGRFISTCERLAEEIEESLPEKFPNISPQSRRQMKDVENIAVMLMFIEVGEKSLSQADIDKAFADRDEDWPEESGTVAAFRSAMSYISDILSQPVASVITGSRLKNQADFYSLFAAVAELQRGDHAASASEGANRLARWVGVLRETERGDGEQDDRATRYLSAARAASNDAGPRRVRIDIIKDVLVGR